MAHEVKIRSALVDDVGTMLGFIRELAIYEKLEHEVVATEAKLRATLFGARTNAEAILLEEDGAAVGFALFFHNYSTFLAQPGLYLEDLYVREACRGRGYGKKLLAHLARLALERDCGRFEWSVLDWNEPAIRFYRSIGAKPLEEWIVQRLTGAELRALAASAPN